MEAIKKELILKEIPLFSGLSASERNIIERKSNIIEYKKNQIIYQEGSPPDAFYCVVSGRVVIYTQDQHGCDTILEYLHRGKYFGIISLLTGEPHSVTAKAMNDCLLLVIKKEDYDFVLKKIPKLAIDLSQTLSRRLKSKDVHQKTIFETTVISVFSSYTQAGKTIYALNLSASLKKETHKSVAILDICSQDKIHSLPLKLEIKDNYRVFDLSSRSPDSAKLIKEFILSNRFGIDLICFHYKPEDDSCVKKIVGILSVLLNDYHYLILDLPSSMDNSIFNILNQSDSIHILTSSEPVDLKRTNSLIERLKTKFGFQETKIRVIINEYRLSKITYGETMELLNHPIFATLPKIEFCASERLVLDDPESEYAKAVRRIARETGECLVGLALGVGVAYGLCHIGVLKVIEEEKIPIDVISGSSFGALLASLWATGRSSEEILKITKEFREPKNIWNMIDVVFPLRGFIKGNKLYNFLKRYLDNKTFYDVKLPLKIVATDIKTKEFKILDKGLLIDAIMASCAMPGVFMPFKLKEEILFDGGIINPLPTEPLFKMGLKKIIAVNVTPSREDIIKQYEKIKDTITSPLEVSKKKRWFNLGEFLKDKLQTNILENIFGSIEMMQSEIAQKEAQLADIVLHPDTSGLFWLELHKAVEFAKRGEEEARKNLDKIWQIINE
jgi:NTE family protein